MQTILGSGGAIGTPLARELKKYTDHIRLVARHPVRVNDDDELFAANLLQAAEVDRAVAGSEVVYLTVGLEYNLAVWRCDWPMLMKHVINACLKHQARLVFLDNIYMYAASAVPHMTEAATVAPPSEKGKVRARLQDMILDAVKEQGLQALIARSADFYGPGVRNGLLNMLVYDKLKAGKKAMWQVDAGKVHSFTYTPDAAAGTAILGNDPAAYGQVWHLPTSSERLTGDMFITLVANNLGVAPRYRTLSRFMMRIAGLFSRQVKELPEMAYQYDRDYFFDSHKFGERYGYRPVAYEEGIRSMVNFEPG